MNIIVVEKSTILRVIHFLLKALVSAFLQHSYWIAKPSLRAHSSQVKLQLALHRLIKKVDSIKSVKLKIKTDKLRIKGDFVLAEVMKIKHMGPNFLLSPSAEIGAPYFHLVLVPKQRRMDFSNYLRRLLMGVKTPVNAMNFMIVVKASKLRIKANVSAYHMDDELVEDYKGAYLDIQVQQTKIPFVKNIQYPLRGDE